MCLPYLFLLYYFHSSSIFVSVVSSFSLLCLKCFKLYLSMCLSPLFLSSPFLPSLSQTVDWYGDTRLCVFLALPQMGPWQHVTDQNVLYLSCQAVPRDQNGSCPLEGMVGKGGSFFSPLSPSLQIEILIVFLLLMVQMEYTPLEKWQKEMLRASVSAPSCELYPNL